MNTDTISYNQAIVSLLFSDGQFDETNAHLAFAIAQDKILDHVLGADLDEQLDSEDVDDVIITVTRNGGVSLF